MSKIIEKNNLIRKEKQLKEEHLISEVRYPYIENSDIRLKEICDRKVKEIYGENVPYEIKNRIEWELNRYNPLDFGLTPFFTFGLEQDEWIDVGINVPTSVHSKIIKSCKNLEGVSDVIPTESEEAFATIKGHNYYILDKVFYFQGIGASDDMQLVYNLSHRLGISDKDINMDDKDIISLFHSNEILGVSSEKIGGVKCGVLGLPTFKE